MVIGKAVKQDGIHNCLLEAWDDEQNSPLITCC